MGVSLSTPVWNFSTLFSKPLLSQTSLPKHHLHTFRPPYRTNTSLDNTSLLLVNVLIDHNLYCTIQSLYLSLISVTAISGGWQIFDRYRGVWQPASAVFKHPPHKKVKREDLAGKKGKKPITNNHLIILVCYVTGIGRWGQRAKNATIHVCLYGRRWHV